MYNFEVFQLYVVVMVTTLKTISNVPLYSQSPTPPIIYKQSSAIPAFYDEHVHF